MTTKNSGKFTGAEKPYDAGTGGATPRKMRDRLQIFVDILQAIKAGEHKKTHILYACAMSSEQWDMHIPDLIDAGMLTQVSTGRFRPSRPAEQYYYDTTPKADEFLAHMATVAELVAKPAAESNKKEGTTKGIAVVCNPDPWRLVEL